MQFLTKQFLMTFAGLGLATDMWHPATREACGVSGLRFRKKTGNRFRNIVCGDLEKKSLPGWSLDPSLLIHLEKKWVAGWQERRFCLQRSEGALGVWGRHKYDYKLKYISNKRKHRATRGVASFDVGDMDTITQGGEKGDEITIEFFKAQEWPHARDTLVLRATGDAHAAKHWVDHLKAVLKVAQDEKSAEIAYAQMQDTFYDIGCRR